MQMRMQMRRLLRLLLLALQAQSAPRFVRIGPPHSHLHDRVLAAVSNAEEAMSGQATGLPATASLPAEVVDAVDRAANENDLFVDRDTADDGNCGPDAILRTMETLGPVTRRAREALNILETRGRAAAIQWIRETCAAWVEAHACMMLVPGVSLSDLVLMEQRYTSVRDYARAMSASKVWIDTPMLVAASAIFEVQIVMFVGAGEPHLLMSPTLAGRSQIHTITLACISNVHFVALRPKPPNDDDTAPIHSETDPLLNYLASAIEDSSNESSAEYDNTVTVSHTVPDTGLLVDADEPFYDRCEKIIEFRPWDMPTVHHNVQTGGVQQNALEVLRMRNAAKMLQMEDVDKTSGENRETLHAIARRYRERRPVRKLSKKMYKQSQSLCDKLSPVRICQHLLKDCSKHGKTHVSRHVQSVSEGHTEMADVMVCIACVRPAYETHANVCATEK